MCFFQEHSITLNPSTLIDEKLENQACGTWKQVEASQCSAIYWVGIQVGRSFSSALLPALQRRSPTEQPFNLDIEVPMIVAGGRPGRYWCRSGLLASLSFHVLYLPGPRQATQQHPSSVSGALPTASHRPQTESLKPECQRALLGRRCKAWSSSLPRLPHDQGGWLPPYSMCVRVRGSKSKPDGLWELFTVPRSLRGFFIHPWILRLSARSCKRPWPAASTGLRGEGSCRREAQAEEEHWYSTCLQSSRPRRSVGLLIFCWSIDECCCRLLWRSCKIRPSVSSSRGRATFTVPCERPSRGQCD